MINEIDARKNSGLEYNQFNWLRAACEIVKYHYINFIQELLKHPFISSDHYVRRIEINKAQEALPIIMKFIKENDK